MNEIERLRAKLDQLMRLRKWNQEDLGRQLGKDQPWVSRRMNNPYRIKAGELVEFARVFGVTVPELFFDEYGRWDRRRNYDRRSTRDRRGSLPPDPRQSDATLDEVNRSPFRNKHHAG